MAGRIRSFDWASTPLGPIARWPQSLKTIVDLMLASPGMMSLVWGPEAIHIYNDSFSALLREHRVLALGRSAYDTFARSREVFEADVAAGMAGRSGRLLAQRYPVLRHGHLEDAWFDADYTPIRDEAGVVAGVLWNLKETTAQHLATQALRASETRHRLLVESWAQAEWETDADGVVVADSPSWRAYTGQCLEDWLGYGWLNAIHPDDRAYAERQWREAIMARGLVDAEFRLRSPDGEWRWTNVRAAPVLDAEGAVEKWIGVNINIDDRHRAETALRESEKKYRALFETMDEAYAVVEVLKDPADRWVDFRFLDANRAFMEHTSMPHPVGKTATELLGSPNPRWTKLYGQALDTSAPIRIEEVEPMLARTFDLNVFPLDPERNQVAVLFTNVTARRAAEEALRRSEERQEFLLRLSDVLQALSGPSELKSAATHLLGQHLGVSRVQYHEVDGSGMYYGADGIGYSDGLPLLDLKYRIEQFGSFVGADFEAGLPFRSPDLQRDPRPTPDERAAYSLYQIRAGAGIPLMRGGKLVAILAVHDIYVHAWTDLEMELIRETAERIWVAVERARAEITLQDSAKRQAFLLAFSDELRALPGTDAVADHAVRRLSEQLQLDRCYLANYRLADDRADITHQVRSDRLPPMPATIQLSDFPAAFRIVFDQTLVIEDVLADQSLSETDKNNILSLGMRALMAPTLRAGAGRPLWVFVAASAQPRHWTGNEIALVEDVAERTWVAVERARGEAALQNSEERFQQFARASSSGLWIRDAATLAMEFASVAMGPIYGVEPDALLGKLEHWASIVVPEDREVAIKHLEAARLGETAVHEFRIQRPADAAFRWIRNTDFPLRDDGRVPRIGGIAEDITDAKLAVEHQGVLLAELQHRVRNIMGMIRSMTNRTAAGAKDVADYRVLLEGRLLALARVQALLTREANAGGSLRGVLEAEIAAQAHHGGQYELTGPDIRLSPKAVEVLTLAFHELATNALKYGAFSDPDGRLAVTWAPFEKRGQPWLALDWAEDGAPARAPSTRRGFGSELIEARIPYELGGRGSITIGPGGARCRLEFPLKNEESVLETDAPQPTTTFGGTLDMTGAPDLSGRTVLVVEDDYYMASDTAAALRGAGAKVLGPCPDAGAARDLLEDERPTHAVLDLNLGGGGPRFEVARLLKSRGVPFLFLTGYDPDVIPVDMQDIVRLQKPLPFQAIVEAVSQLPGSGGRPEADALNV